MAALKKSVKIGIIAEDQSDVETIKVLLQKVTTTNTLSVKKRLGYGCGKIRRKAKQWALELAKEGCQRLLLVHDRDRNDAVLLRADLIKCLGESPIRDHLIIVPVEELEAWLLCDPDALKKVFSLKKLPKLPSNPETINSPKEFLEKLIRRESDKRRTYVNTIHNSKIMENITLKNLRKCSEFSRLEKYWIASPRTGLLSTNLLGNSRT